MSTVQRFNNRAGLMNPEANGLYVRYEDHIAALSQPVIAVPVEATAEDRAIYASIAANYAKDVAPTLAEPAIQLTAEEHQVLRAAVRDSAEVVAPGRLAEPAQQDTKGQMLLEAVTRAILFEDRGSSEDWRENTNLGEAAIRVCDARNPPRCSYCHASSSQPIAAAPQAPSVQQAEPTDMVPRSRLVAMERELADAAEKLSAVQKSAGDEIRRLTASSQAEPPAVQQAAATEPMALTDTVRLDWVMRVYSVPGGRSTIDAALAADQKGEQP